MPKKKRGDADKPIPEILRTPMTYDWDSLVEATFAKLTGKRIDARVLDRQMAQLTERLQAADRHVDAPPNSDNTISERDLRFYVAQFPNGFRVIPEGLNVKGPRKWTMARKIDLVSFIDNLRECSSKDGERRMTIKEAARWYLYLPEDKMRNPEGIKNRYHEFKKQLASGNFTTSEKLELAELHLQQLSAKSTK